MEISIDFSTNKELQKGTGQKCPSGIPFLPPVDPKFTFIDLFAGIGGFRIAMQNCGGKCIFTSEWDINSQKTYYMNFGDIPKGDITKEETTNLIPPYFDLLCAGFPCQAFSIAGKRLGFKEDRGTLFFNVAEIIKKHRPKAVFLENVKGLLNHNKGNTFKVVLTTLQNLNYTVHYQICNTMNYVNIPQNRERVFIVAFNNETVDKAKEFEFPETQELTNSIQDYTAKIQMPDKYYYHKEHKYFNELNSVVVNQNTVYQWRRVYVRENKSGVCPTLTANMGTGGHNVPIIRDDFGIRKLTPSECLSLQGFPVEKFIFPNIPDSKKYMQIGNSVTEPLIQLIGTSIINTLMR